MTVHRFARRAPALAAAALAACLIAGPASAQWFGQPAYVPMSPRAVASMLYGQGFLEVERPRWTGYVYMVEGVDRYGIRVRLAVDAYGDVLSRRNLVGAPIPPRDVGRGGVGAVPVEPFRDDPRAAPRRERPSRQAARPETPAKPPVASRARPQAPIGARAPEPSIAKPVTATAQPAPVESTPPPPAPAASPAAPAPSIAAPRPDAPREAPTAAAPAVRVIEGVTPVVPREPAETPAREPETPPTAID